MAEFDRTVRDNRLEAEEALKKIDIIRGFINEAEQKTAEARANLADAESDARLASQIAMMAKSTSEDTWNVRESRIVCRQWQLMLLLCVSFDIRRDSGSCVDIKKMYHVFQNCRVFILSLAKRFCPVTLF